MEAIGSFFQTGFAFVVLLGVLVFIHEFGHFIVAKAFGMRVETFSIGMGKKLLTFTRGETEYAISLIPLGGYVKITGQDPREEITPDLAHRSFRDKPIYQRTAVVLAGPLFNAALAVLVFIFLYGVGVPSRSAVLERVLPDSPAAMAGFRSGDKVLKIKLPNNKSVRIYDLSDLEKTVGTAAGQKLLFTVERKLNPLPALTQGTIDPSLTQSEVKEIQYTPEIGQERDSMIGVIQTRGIIRGAEKTAPSSLVFARHDSWAEVKGIEGYWLITELSYLSNSAEQRAFKISSFFELQNAWAFMAEDLGNDQGTITIKGQNINLDDLINQTADTTPTEQSFEIAWMAQQNIPKTLAEAGLNSGEMVIAEVKSASPAEKLGLKSGDWIQNINQIEALSFQSFRESLQEISNANEIVSIEWIRDGETMQASVTPEIVDSKDPVTEISKQQFQIGAAFLASPAPPSFELVKADSFGASILLGWDRTVGLTKSMLSSFYLLATGEISPKTLGGPILIAKISGESMKQGYASFLRMMAFISLNLFILNLLPIPVLDGGHLVLFMVEAIRRKPMSIRAIEIWTTAGFFLLMGIVAIVFFNDLSRLGLFRIFQS